MLKILLADDNADVRRGLAQYLQQELPDVAICEASGGEDAVRQVKAENWSIVVLDIYMPGQSGLDVLRAIKRERADLPVIMLSMYASHLYVSESMKAGASGYVLKELSPNELVAAIRAATAGETYLSEAVRDFWDQPAR
jgi:two-component system invasion response regulator UvrY